MTVHAIHFVFTFNPRFLIVDLLTPIGQVVEILRRPSEILHPVRVIAVTPVVFLVEDWAETRLVAVE